MTRIDYANLRDATYVMGNLRAHDDIELRCQLSDTFDIGVLTHQALITGEARIAYVHDEPVALFGTTLMTVCCASIWAVSTSRYRRAVPAMSRCFIDELIPQRLEQGITSMEARAWIENEAALRWIESMGGKRLGEPFLYGKAGEMFQLFRWTVASYRTIARSRWSREEHVLD